MAGPVERSGIPLERGGKPLEGCGGCPVMPFAFTFVSSGGNPFVDDDLTWNATAVGGVSPGWLYNGGDLQVCPNTGAASLVLRAVLLWCAGGVWESEIVYLVDGIQFNASTVTSGLDPFVLNNPSSPRTYYTRTTSDTDEFCNSGWLGHFRLDVAVKL